MPTQYSSASTSSSRGSGLRLEGDQGQFIQGRTDLRDTLSELNAAIDFSAPIIDMLRPGGSTTEAYLAFLPLLAKLNRLAASVHERGAEFGTLNLQNLEQLSWVFTGLLTSLILGSFGLIALTRWNYGMLVATHHEVSDLADDLHVQNARFDAALNNMSQRALDGDRRSYSCGLQRPI